MASPTLQGKKVAILVADGFEQVELLEPGESAGSGRCGHRGCVTDQKQG